MVYGYDNGVSGWGCVNWPLGLVNMDQSEKAELALYGPYAWWGWGQNWAWSAKIKAFGVIMLKLLNYQPKKG